MPTSTLSQLLPALIFLRSAANSGLRPTVNARPAMRESPRRTHAFDQSRRPADPKRHTAVIVRLKQTETKCFTSASRMTFLRSIILPFQTLNSILGRRRSPRAPILTRRHQRIILTCERYRSEEHTS